MPNVVVVGTLNVDFVWRVGGLPRPGQTIIAEATECQFGGKGANQAVAAARQGARVSLIGATGMDADGERYREHLAREGVSAVQVVATARFPTGRAHVYVDPQGENLIVVDRGANQALDGAAVRIGLENTAGKVDVLLTQLECPLDAAVTALELAAARGVRTVLNPSPVNAAFPWGGPTIDTVIVNEHECAECFAHSPAELWALTAAALRALLSARRVRQLVITQGAEPTLLLSVSDRLRVPTYRVEPRDTVGAGDMFAGALATELAAGRGAEAALWHANVAAALSTLALGAQTAMPTRAEVEAAVAQWAAPA